MSSPPPPPPPGGEPSEEELRAAYEAELARITATDMIAQAAVSLLNIGARRMGPPPVPPGAEPPPPGSERDLEQVRDSIDAAMGLLGVLERRVPADQLRPLRDALSRLQMAYAAEVGGSGNEGDGDEGEDDGPGGPGGPGDAGPGGGPGAGPGPGPGDGAQERGPGPAQSSGRLWVPGQ